MNPGEQESFQENNTSEDKGKNISKKSGIAIGVSAAMAGTMLISQIFGGGRQANQAQASSTTSMPPTEIPISQPLSTEETDEEMNSVINKPSYEDYFAYEINTYKYFNEIIQLKEIIDTLPANYDGGLGDYLRGTDWYTNVAKNQGLESALNIMNITKVEGQPLQCVVLAILLSNLKDPDLPVQNIGGATAFDMGERGASSAIEFVPYTLLHDKYRDVVANNYGGVTLRTTDFQIEDFEVGDVVIIGNRGKIVYLETEDSTAWETHIGHVAVIIGEKKVDGKNILLVAESNKGNDGKITITLVDESNITESIDPGSNTFVIRMNKNYSPVGN